MSEPSSLDYKQQVHDVASLVHPDDVTAVADLVPVTSDVVLVNEDDTANNVGQLRRQLELLRLRQDREDLIKEREDDLQQLEEQKRAGRHQPLEEVVQAASTSKKETVTSKLFSKISRQTSAGMTNVGISAYKTKKNAQIQATKFNIAERKKQFGLDYMTLKEEKSTTERQLQDCMETAMRDLDQLRNQLDRHHNKIMIRQQVAHEKITAQLQGTGLPKATAVQRAVAVPIQSNNVLSSRTPHLQARSGNSNQEDAATAPATQEPVTSTSFPVSCGASSLASGASSSLGSYNGSNHTESTFASVHASRREGSVDGKQETVEKRSGVPRDPDGDYVHRMEE